jgi:ABC-2 type transport system permease protein
VDARDRRPATTPGAIVQLVIWFFLGYILYATALGFFGSLATRMEEASNASTPITIVATASYLLAFLAVGEDPTGTVARVMTFLPPSAPMVVPLRAALDAIEPWGIGVSIALTVAAIWALFVVGGRIYAGAVLQTTGRIELRDAWRAADE